MVKSRTWTSISLMLNDKTFLYVYDDMIPLTLDSHEFLLDFTLSYVVLDKCHKIYVFTFHFVTFFLSKRVANLDSLTP